MRELPLVEQRIVAALQVSPRASWRRVAAVLREPERAVSRYGTALIESGVVTVVGMRVRPAPVLVQLRCAPGTTRLAARVLAQRADVSFVYTVTGGGDCLAEIVMDRDQLGAVLGDELPGVIGLQQVVTYPVLRYFKTLRDWQPGVLSAAHVRALRPETLVDPEVFGQHDELNQRDQQIIDVLCQNGRASFESIGRKVGVSEATARRRTEWLLANNCVHLRAVVEPQSMGLPVEALLWIKTPPTGVEQLGCRLAMLPQTRYLAAIAGDYQIVADVTLPNNQALYDFTTGAEWAEAASAVTVTLVLEALKRGGRRSQVTGR